jgi:NADH dehydrogenase (ubiquinone) Fe-S protein 3
MQTKTKQIGNYLLKISPILNFKINKQELIVNVYYTDIIKILLVLKLHTNSQFKYVSDISVIDYPENKNRFVIVYNLLSIRYNSRIRLKTSLNILKPIESITPLYSCANWWEREIWDMFGIFFIGHPDLRRILTDYGFEGFPLRKDFPLNGFLEARYDYVSKTIIFESIQQSQKFNLFSFKNPWKNF